MDADGGIHHCMLVGQLNRPPAVGECRARVNDERNAGLPCTCDDVIPIGIEFTRRQVRVGVNEHLRHPFRPHFTMLPLAISPAGVTIIRWPAVSDAARSIPWDSCPINLAGCRLKTTTTDLPTSVSGA